MKRLSAQLPEFAPILHFATVDSTQTALAEHLQHNRGRPGHWHLAIADEQLAGRGRTGARWHAQAGDAVLMTLAAPLLLPLDKWPRASLVAGLAAAEALGEGVKLKWPNDLFVQADGWKKLGGILCERLETNTGPWWLCGIGVNVRQVPAEVAGYAAALEPGQDRVEEQDRVDVAVRLARQIRQRIERFVMQQGQLPLAELHARLAFRGMQVVMQDGVQGELQGLAEDGGLRVAGHVVRAGSIVRVEGENPWQAAAKEF
jgi:biotin-[acetyl-CoA-carboxylase] ligase BirA-like protein